MSKLTYEQAAGRLLERDGFLILTHVRPDGDTVGCAAALCTALREQGKEAYVLPNPELTAIFTPYLEGLLAPSGYEPKTVVSVDMAARGLFPDNAQRYLDQVDLAFDHHPSQEFFARETCLDADRAACGELMYDVIRQWGPVSQAVALPLYVAVSTDTGCFVYSNTSPATHAVAAALLETGIDFYPINRRHFRTRSLKRLKLEGMLTAGMELLDGGELAIVTLTLDMIAQVEAKEEDLDDISAFVGGVEGVHTGVTMIADGTEEADFRLAACMTTDSGIGVVRHAQSGYQSAKDVCNGKGKIAGGESIKIPLWWEPADKVTFGPEGEYVR